MSRGLSIDILDALDAKQSDIVLLADLEFDSGNVRLWSGYGLVKFNGETYSGSGLLGTISSISDTEETKSTGMSLNLSGIPSEIISLALNTEDYKNRIATIYLGFLGDLITPNLLTIAGLQLFTIAGEELTTIDEEAGYVLSAFPIFKGIMDVMTIEDGADTANISISVENRLARLLKVNETRYTDQDQKSIYPDDRAFEYVAGLQGQETDWGKTT